MCRTREYQLSTLSPIRILTKDAYAITRVCACAVGRLRGEWGNTQQTSSPPQHFHSTICGNVSWRPCNRSKVRQLILVARSRLSTVRVSRSTEEMHKFIAEQLQTGRVPLCINPQSAAFKSFARWVRPAASFSSKNFLLSFAVVLSSRPKKNVHRGSVSSVKSN